MARDLSRVTTKELLFGDFDRDKLKNIDDPFPLTQEKGVYWTKALKRNWLFTKRQNS